MVIRRKVSRIQTTYSSVPPIHFWKASSERCESPWLEREASPREASAGRKAAHSTRRGHLPGPVRARKAVHLICTRRQWAHDRSTLIATCHSSQTCAEKQPYSPDPEMAQQVLPTSASLSSWEHSQADRRWIKGYAWSWDRGHPRCFKKSSHLLSLENTKSTLLISD